MSVGRILGPYEQLDRRVERLEKIAERFPMPVLEALLKLTVSIHPSRHIGAHACWTGLISEYAVLQPFVCESCQQLVGIDHSTILISYLECKSHQGVR